MVIPSTQTQIFCFIRLIMLINKAEDLTDYFDEELTPETTSLFKDGLMRKPNKAQFGRELVKKSEILREISKNTTYVLDRGALLHPVFWNLPATYSNIMEQYCTYILRKYGNHVHIVFHGYKSSIKDHEHQRRGKTFANIVFKPIANNLSFCQTITTKHFQKNDTAVNKFIF